MRLARLVPVLLAAMLAALPGAGSAASRALVIGIDKYPGIQVNGVGGARDLRGATADARNMQKALAEHFGIAPADIKLLVDSEATREAILAAFRDWLVEGTTSGDRAVFYFAGHGAQVEDEDGDEGEDRFDEVLAPHDVKGELQGPDAGLSGFITDDEMDSLLAQLPGRDVLVIVDACHSGTITRGALEVRATGDLADPAGQGMSADGSGGYSGVRTLTPNGPLASTRSLDDLGTREAHRSGSRLIEVVGTGEPEASEPEGLKLAAWTATASSQLALEDAALGGGEGLFTNRFVKGIATLAADLNGNGTVTASELLAYLRGESETYCSTYSCGPGGLTPTLEAWDGYDAEVLAGTTQQADTPDGYGAEIASADALPALYTEAAGSVSVTLSQDGYSRLGDPLVVRLKSDRAGELIVLDIRDDGTTVQLFPNRPSLKAGVETTVRAGEERLLPGDLDPFQLVPDSAGSGRIVALVTDPGTSVADLTGKYLDLQPIPSPDLYVAEVTRALNRAVDYPGGSEAALEQPATAATYARGEARYVIK